MSDTAVVYLIPTWIDESAPQTLPAYILEIVQQCQDLFVENERTTRRFLKSLRKEIVIDSFNWYRMDGEGVETTFRQSIRSKRVIGIISEAGCPGIADPGQALVAIAQEMQMLVRPLVGPSSILLALMGSGMNGQSFTFHGYLPIDASVRNQAIRALEQDSLKHQRTQLFIETPYRNNALLQALLQLLQPGTRLCIAADITAPTEFIQTKTVSNWKKQQPDLHKRPVLFLLQA
jgi:16S rRNA (cytidine1402-2'-O)-methyltransferase